MDTLRHKKLFLVQNLSEIFVLVWTLNKIYLKELFLSLSVLYESNYIPLLSIVLFVYRLEQHQLSYLLWTL